MLLGELFLDFAIIVYLAFLSINEENLTWLETTLGYDVCWFEVHNTYLTGYHHHTILCYSIT